MGSGQNGIYGLAQLEAGTTEGIFKDDTSNTLMWVTSIPAQSKKKIALHYNVFYPKDIVLELAKE